MTFDDKFTAGVTETTLRRFKKIDPKFTHYYVFDVTGFAAFLQNSVKISRPSANSFNILKALIAECHDQTDYLMVKMPSGVVRFYSTSETLEMNLVLDSDASALAQYIWRFDK